MKVQKMLKSVCLGLVLLLTGASALAESPDITLRDLDGKPRNVNEFIGHGNWTIVVVWSRDCLLCNREIHHMTEFHNSHQDKGATVLGVSIDGVEQMALAREFVSFHKLPFVNLVAEPEQEVMMKFGAGPFVATPTHYFYDPNGKLVGRKVGPLPRKDLEAFLEAPNTRRYAF